MMVDKYSKDGKVVGQVELPGDLFGGEVNDYLIYALIKTANANRRQGTHSTKGRSQVRGGGAKPWRQKGTGRARSGTSRSPIWRGGGVAFGPKPRDYSRKLPKNIRKAAYRSLFALKAKEGGVKIIEDFTVSGKTKEMAAIGKSLSLKKGVLISDSDDIMLKRSIRNIPWFIFNNVNRISGRDIFYSKDMVFTESALNSLKEKYAAKK